MGGEVEAIAIDGDLVYVGGDFRGGVRVWNNRTLTWSDLGGGLDGVANDLAAVGCCWVWSPRGSPV